MADPASRKTSPRWSTSPRLAGYENLFVNAIQTVNKNQKKRFVDKIDAKLGRPIDGAKIAVWGLAFKADTDDIRESAAIDVIRYLLDTGRTCQGAPIPRRWRT